MSSVSNKNNNSSNTNLGSTDQHTSSLFINIQQLQTGIQVQHQHEKESLNELNQRFHHSIDRVRLLESQNLKYRTKLTAIRKQPFDDNDIKSIEHFSNIKSELSKQYNATIDCKSDFEWSQLQIGIYQKWIDIEQQQKGKQLSELEQELKQVVSNLNILHKSYAELERTAKNQYVERDNLFTQYLTLTHNWCNQKAKRKKYDQSMELLKNNIVFYKNLSAYIARYTESLPTQSNDEVQYWAGEYDKSIKKIHHDFELFYANIYRDLTSYYEIKMEEVRKEVEQTKHEQRLETEEFVISQQALEKEYEKVQYSLTHEKEILHKLESVYSKLEAELKSLEIQHEEKLELQAKEIHHYQESIMTIAFDINEMQSSKINLETEIIIYRYILNAFENEEQVTIVPHKSTVANETIGKFIAKGRKKHSIGIKECAANGKYISLLNYSTTDNIDISKWILKQRTDSASEIQYIIPDGVVLKQGIELRIYSKLGSANADRSSNENTLSRLVNNNVTSWGVGNTIEIHLFNQYGEKQASYLESIEARATNI
ncbi:unnamed protein product [Adineta steineri]|uniref:LTD domain-containing protein n=1 Tax=Adineta steineri TaxID=433720 RepID=A0A814MS93_9BILA|nr:unnamed protein product [Adineta steineri]CAF1426706.1 unnamed protein product [Adineta steineri]CAF1429467.1 unnamed protein product [Adineta steineri]